MSHAGLCLHKVHHLKLNCTHSLPGQIVTVSFRRNYTGRLLILGVCRKITSKCSASVVLWIVTYLYGEFGSIDKKTFYNNNYS